MSRKTRRNSNAKPAAILIVLGLTIVGLLAYYVKTNPELPPRDPDVVAGKGGQRQETKRYHIYDPEKGWSPIAVPVSRGEDPKRASLVAFTSRAYPAKNVRLLSVDVRDNAATVNFSRGFAEGMGSDEEGTLIEGLMRVLGQFEEIEKAQILVDGEVLETGHNEYSEIAVIRP